MKQILTLLAAAGIALAPGMLRADPPPSMTACSPITLSGAAAKFDYMQFDAKYGRVYASHPGAQTLTVYDIKAQKASEIAVACAVNGVAIDDRDGRVFAAGGGQKLFAFDRATLDQTAVLDLGEKADDIVFDADSGNIYADQDDGTQIWVVSAKTMKIMGTVAIAGAPEYILYDKATHRIYQNIKATDSLQAVDPATNAVVATWPTAPATKPHGLAIDSKTGRAFVAGSSGKLVVISLTDGSVVASVDIKPKSDQIAFDPTSRRLYCLGGGFMSIVHETDKGAELVDTIATPAKAHTLAIDPRDHSVWTSYFDDTNSYFQQWMPAK